MMSETIVFKKMFLVSWRSPILFFSRFSINNLRSTIVNPIEEYLSVFYPAFT